MSYNLEVENFGQWEFIAEFSHLAHAKTHGEEQYSQNKWRIIRNDMRIEHYHDPISAIAVVGQADLERFHRTAQWVAGESARQAQRRARARSLRFSSLNRIQQTLHDDEWEIYSSKVDWKKEGF